MAESRNFRSSLNGFNREDVVRYIEYLNTKHTTLVNQLKSEKQSLEDELEALRNKQAEPSVSMEEHAAVVQELEALRAEMETLQVSAATAAQQRLADEELAAYRRAEQAERVAKERSQQMYRQAAAMLADATIKVGGSAAMLDTLTVKVSSQLYELQAAVADSRATLQDTADAIAAIGIVE